MDTIRKARKYIEDNSGNGGLFVKKFDCKTDAEAFCKGHRLFFVIEYGSGFAVLEKIEPDSVTLFGKDV